MGNHRGFWPYSSQHLIPFIVALATLIGDRESSDVRDEVVLTPLSDEDARGAAASPRLSWQSRLELADAIMEWLKPGAQENGRWEAAFVVLRRVLDRDGSHDLDIRLYLYNHSDAAGNLYKRFMQEEQR